MCREFGNAREFRFGGRHSEGCIRGGPSSSWRASDQDKIAQPAESFTIAQLPLPLAEGVRDTNEKSF